MQLDLNYLLEKIHSWKNVVKKKDEAIEDLQQQIKECKQHIESTDNINSTLLQEVSRQNSIISSLHQSLFVVEKTEADNKALVEDIQKLKNNFKEQEKLQLSRIAELNKKIEKLEADRKRDVENKIVEIEDKASSELEKCAINIREKENYILILKDEISNFKQEKDQEILKIQIEYQEKLGRMKNKMNKNKGVHHHDFKSNDFFRQKYMEKEKEAKEESMKLKKEIDDLKREVTSLKSNILNVTAQKDSFQTEQFYTTDQLNHSFEEYHPTKRSKINRDDLPNSTTNDSLVVDSTQDDFESHVTITSFQKQTSATTPFKKKLFNLDMNYFNK